MTGSVLSWLLPLLRCPVCCHPLRSTASSPDADDAILEHAPGTCSERYPIIGGIPRLVSGAARQRVLARHTAWFDAADERRALRSEWAPASGRADPIVSSFDYEWTRFPSAGNAELAAVFDEYFDLIGPDAFADNTIVLDAGCGGGRWSLEAARRGPRVIAVDLGESIEVARRNTASTGRVACVQADLHELPIAEGSVDWAFSLGVLHHLAAPPRALARIFDAVRAPGPVLVYVYYALDHRGSAYRGVFRVISAVRRVTSTLPRPLSFAFAAAVAAIVYFPLARMARLAERRGWAGVAAGLPLSYYRHRSFGIMLNDSLDRFGTSRELRFTRGDVAALYAACGATDVEISPNAPYWHAVGSRRT